ncbi:MAG: hypothetical protein P8K68_02955 [Algibacter sp.]|nr:hypothetical protein [Algibacter sp.]MDG1729527.1 hypothetical protein [Algibacter sp.]MDG2177729.1 hypothetical protein [Algibacter sp.]
MKSITKISRQLGTITQENILSSKRIIDFQMTNNGVWQGTKRYAH